MLRVAPVESETTYDLKRGEDGLLRMKRFGIVRFTLAGQACALTFCWLMR